MPNRLAFILLGALTAAGCDSQPSDQKVGVSRADVRTRYPLSFTTVVDPQGVRAGEREVRRVITSASQYKRVLGHAQPAGVGFSDRDTIVLYDAGVKRTGGYQATVERIEATKGTLFVATRLESPGSSCPVTQNLSHPYVLVKLKRPRGIFHVHFERLDIVRECYAPRTCADITCPDGQHCKITPVVCIRAPCPAVAECVPDEPPPPFCGGIAAIPCPGSGQCKDNPTDDCDPDDGGADCGGFCDCRQSIDRAPCQPGNMFDPNPNVCACVRDPTQDPCAAVRCRAGTHCLADDTGATCMPDAPFCGGIAGFPCPGAGTCVDNPNDDCDPKKGGADCGGLCECNALGFCIPGYVWDGSPDVCTCVLMTNPCIFTLCQTGTTCQVIDAAAVCISDGTQPCGSSVCSKGNVCCNASCGVCTAPGMFCTQQACAPPD